MSVTMIVPASAQFWGSWDRRPQQQPQRQQPQQPQQYNPFGGFWGPSDNRQQREAPADNSRAPNAQKNPNPAAATTVVVVGDGMADWLAYGLEDAFSEKPEIAIVRKHRTASGLIRYDTRREVEWAQVVKETITADKPKFIVMMLGVNDRQQIRERAPTTPAAAAARQTPAKPATAEPAPAPDPELQAQQSADAQNAEQQEAPEPVPAPIVAPEPRGAQGNLGPFEFHTEKWEAGYIRRIDATIAAMKSAGVPVLWVGLPSQRNTRASSDSTYLNDLYRQRAEKAGIIYVDIWDGFVDDAGRFTQQGPDFEGQIRRLRAADGIYFTKPGARKLAHYVEREILRSLSNRALPVALPAVEPAPATPGARPGSPARPLAGPVVPLTVSAGGGDELLGATRVVRPAAVDPVATRVLTKGEAIAAPSGRADDFNWPRGSIPTAIVEPAAPAAASAPAPAAPARGQASSGQPASSGQQAEDTKPAASQPAPKRARPTAPPAADAPPRPPAAVRPSASSSPFWNVR